MRITGHHALPFPVETVWEALLDPEVLVATIPGCERLEATGKHSYAMTVSAGVASIRGTYDGTCTLSDLVPHESLTMRLRGAGAPGTVDAAVGVGFAATDDGTRITYDADAVVGGMVGGVGQRMLTSVSQRMAKEFFDNVATAIADADADADADAEAGPGGTAAPGDEAAGEPSGRVFLSPRRPAGSTPDLVKGLVVGAGLALLGVLVGARLGRRWR